MGVSSIAQKMVLLLIYRSVKRVNETFSRSSITIGKGKGYMGAKFVCAFAEGREG